MALEVLDGFAALTAATAIAGLAQSGFGWRAVQRFVVQPASLPAARPPVTVLKPLHGDEPLLEDALASFCAQDYPCLQIVFGLQSLADPALHVLRRLRARFPALDMEIVVDPTPHGTNLKVANLLNMFPSAKHDVLVVADSDIHAAPDYIDRLVARLLQPGTGLVTTLYAGRASSDTLSGRLGATQLNHSFLPGALMARSLGRQDCLGATMALTRETLTRVGGLAALSNHLADDAVLGRLVAAKGLSVELAATVPATTVPETTLPALMAHELRWARTIRSVAPVGFVLSAIQCPLAWAAMAVASTSGAPWALGLFLLAWIARAVFAIGIDRALGIAQSAPIWCLPLRDLLSVGVILASYRTNQVAWRGQIMRATSPTFAPGKG